MTQIRIRPLDERNPTPLVVEPESASQDRSRAALLAWLSENEAPLRTMLRERGALLFRGFGLETVEDFEALVRAFSPELRGYVGGNSPRTRVTNGVYTSTEYPAHQSISLHNELSYTHSWPRHLFFFCETPPEHRGETPILDCRKLYASLDEGVRERFRTKRLRYVQNLHAGHGFGKSWQATFETSDRAAVERALQEAGASYRWKPDGGLWVGQEREAVITHPETGEPVWFNQAEQWHASSLPAEVRDVLLKVFKEQDLPQHCFHADGSPLPVEELEHIRRTMREQTILFPWQRSDVLMLDNVLMAHGREPFKGPRRILVAMS